VSEKLATANVDRVSVVYSIAGRRILALDDVRLVLRQKEFVFLVANAPRDTMESWCWSFGPYTTPAGPAHAILTPPPRSPHCARPADHSGRSTARGADPDVTLLRLSSPVGWLASGLSRPGRRW
jgi:hypothetical protein